jgi:aerobic-type carbon monoxide dehydrogenase small subunit (CoxS/CutS family)
MSQQVQQEVSFVLNGEPVTVWCADGALLTDLLRDDLDCKGVKVGCESGACGACTVIVDDEPALACVMFASDAEGRRIETVEGLELEPGVLHPLQAAFIRHDAVQCGFCTPGMLMAATALLADIGSPSRAEISRALCGNLCRCTGYVKIIDAIEAVSAGVNPEEQSVGEGE